MTRKEIIDGLKFTIEIFLLDTNTGKTFTEPRNDMDKITIDACKGAIELLEQEPTTDVVEVVRCKDCVEWQTDWTPSCGANGSHYCATMDTMTKPNDFCSKAERGKYV